jgi:hypothetical protein
MTTMLHRNDNLLQFTKNIQKSHEKHSILAQELQSALKFTEGFRTVILKCKKFVISV